MHKKITENSRLFFIEFLIVLFFFLIISTICLKLFVQAHKITVDSENLSRAQSLAASAAELLLAGYDVDETIAICQEQEDVFCIQIVEGSNSAPSYTQYLITIDQKDGTSLYHLPLSVFHSYCTAYTEAIEDTSFAETEVQP